MSSTLSVSPNELLQEHQYKIQFIIKIMTLKLRLDFATGALQCLFNISSLLMHGVISLSDATSYEKQILVIHQSYFYMWHSMVKNTHSQMIYEPQRDKINKKPVSPAKTQISLDNSSV